MRSKFVATAALSLLTSFGASGCLPKPVPNPAPGGPVPVDPCPDQPIEDRKCQSNNTGAALKNNDSPAAATFKIAIGPAPTKG